jgi:hypothetical protein
MHKYNIIINTDLVSKISRFIHIYYSMMLEIKK